MHHKVTFTYHVKFDRIMCVFGDFLGKRTLCDAYHNEHINVEGELCVRIKTLKEDQEIYQ